jgi:hypothetical protein
LSEKAFFAQVDMADSMFGELLMPFIAFWFAQVRTQQQQGAHAHAPTQAAPHSPNPHASEGVHAERAHVEATV